MPRQDLSVQLYTVRKALAEDFGGTLRRIASIGYTKVEPFQFIDFLGELKEGMSKYGLSAPTAHAGLLSGDQDAIFAAANELGIETVIDPHVPQERWQSLAGIEQIATELNLAAEQGAQYGLRVGYHNHHFELQTLIDGKGALEILVESLSPRVVLEVDTYWAYAGGADVPSLLKRLGERVVALHIKDGDGGLDVKKQVAVGSGSLPIWEFIDAAPNALRVVELDDSTEDMITAIRVSRDFLLDKKDSSRTGHGSVASASPG